jgi:hypothetical protein
MINSLFAILSGKKSGFYLPVEKYSSDIWKVIYTMEKNGEPVTNTYPDKNSTGLSEEKQCPNGGASKKNLRKE